MKNQCSDIAPELISMECNPLFNTRSRSVAKYDFYIGIDPGINCGIAIWCSFDKSFDDISTLKLHKVFMMILSYPPQNIIVYIENPNTFVPFGKVSREEIDARRQGAGSVKQTFKHIIEFLEDHKIDYVKTRLQGGMKKMKAENFKRQTGWDKSTDEHGRDAAMLVYGR